MEPIGASHVTLAFLAVDIRGRTVGKPVPRFSGRGHVVANKDGTLTYFADPGFVGEDTFYYWAQDDQGNFTRAQVTVTVNDKTQTFQIAEVDSVCKYIDMPLQHISDRMLRSMRRERSGNSVRKLIERIRGAGLRCARRPPGRARLRARRPARHRA